MWGALSDERPGLSFTVPAGPRQLSHSCIRILRDRLPYFTVSDSRLPQTGGAGPPIYVPQEQSGPDIPPGTGSLFVASYDSYAYGRGNRPRHGPHRRRFFHYCMFCRYRGNMSTELFLSNGCCTVACLHSCYLEMGLHVTIFINNKVISIFS
jgi:hypothetical protein